MDRCVGYLLGILMVIQLRGDGYFPFPKSWPQPLLLGIVLVHTLVLAALIVRCAYGLVAEHQPEPLAIPPWVHRLLLGAVPFIALGAISGLHLLQARYYQFAGYRMDVVVLTGFLLISVAPLSVYWTVASIKRRFLPQAFLASVAASA
ncbi:MAG: hypothetical protein HYZ73_05775, partial [Elusimicrobia bacterium]|nr:hypothetical protein [Elusimicrobiota bacterium]